MPPATTMSNSPARISWSASAIASSPDRQTLLIVSAGVLIGMPAPTAAWRAGDLPGAGLQDLAHDHVLHLLGGDAGALQGAP